MQKSLLKQQLPEGMLDILPETTALLEKLEQDLIELFRLWSFDKVITPTIEFAACVQPDIDREDQLYKFFDRQGRILALRPEFTTPIARMVSSRMQGEKLPLRLSYSGDVFRYSAARQREFRQTGVELIGSPSAMADAEIVALAIESFRQLGIKDFQLSIGQMNIFAGLLEEVGIDGPLRVQLENSLSRKDIVEIENLVHQNRLTDSVREILLRLPRLNGGVEILDEVLHLSKRPSLLAAVENLRNIYDYLMEFGVQDAVTLDMGILRGFSYYTGVIFEGYVPGIGFPVVEGGRYDMLYNDFQNPLPATGFAINLSSVIELFLHHECQDREVIDGENMAEVIRRCRELRSQGIRAEMVLK